MIYQLLKSLALRWLPDSALLAAKRIHYARRLRALAPAAEPDLLVVQHLVTPGNVVLDVGANIGVYTVSIARWVGNTGIVLAFEPVPPTFEILSSNVKRLGLTNVETLCCAASDTEHAVTMEVPLFPQGGHNYYESRISPTTSSDANLRRFATTAVRIDRIVGRRGLRVDLIKMDVEGHELPALQGACNVLERDRPALLVEISGDPDRAGSSAHELLDMLVGLGYSPWWFDGSRLRPRHASDRRSNIFFLMEPHLLALKPMVEP